MKELVRDQAFNIYIRAGGKEEHWGEDREDSTVEDLLRRWRESEWATALNGRNGQRQARRWVGTSFEVGNFLGSNILKETMYSRSTRSLLSGSTHARPSFASPPIPEEPATPITMQNSYFPFTNPPRRDLEGGPFALASHPSVDVPSSSDNHDEVAPAVDESASSSTALLAQSRNGLLPRSRTTPAHTVARFEMQPHPSMPSVLVNTDSNVRTPGRQRLVHYADSPVIEPRAPPKRIGTAVSGMPDYDVSPVSPSEVLGRNGSDVEDTSAGATPDVQAIPTDYNGIVLRDRMLVRPSFLRDAALSAHFDEAENRTTRNMLHNDWKEYMVVWRRNHIELHEDYSTPGKEWLTGHKQLSFIIPIRRNKLNVTVYSFVDMTFCLSYANDPSSRSRQVLHLDKNGTNVFVFKVKTRSRAMDWYWALWRKLGGELPLLVEIRNPILDTRLKVELPDLSIMPIERAATIVSRDNLIALCMKSLRNADDFKSVVERALDKGDRLELAWRMDTNLDWIWLDEDVRGDPRYWAVLCGLALKQGKTASHLEIRLGRHYPEHLRTADGRRIDEPLSIEGYVDRIRPNTQLKHPVYLSTHDGFLFFVNQNVAQPPQPPGYVQLPPQDVGGDDDDDPATPPSLEAYASILRRSEVRRGARQVMAAHAVCDLRSVVAVRRAFQVVPAQAHDVRNVGEDDVGGPHEEPVEEADHADLGGDEAIDQTGDRPHMKMRRSFELLLENGHVMRFETHSCKNAIEWVTRLRALLLYWRMRKRNDAQEEMELARARRPLITPHLHPYHHDETDRAPEPPPDASAPLPALGSLFNWCVIDGCKPVIRAGRVFMRRGLNGPYKEVRLFLIAGHLVSFRMRRGTLVHRAMKRKLNLVDAYVVSGYFAALSLPRGQFSPGDESLPRRYQDGLESDDPEDDLLFMVWYRKQQPSLGPANISEEGVIEPPAVAVPANIPALSAKATVAVFRTRSKLERDAWCWSINCEMEKIVREQKEREERLRNTGSLKST